MKRLTLTTFLTTLIACSLALLLSACGTAGWLRDRVDDWRIPDPPAQEQPADPPAVEEGLNTGGDGLYKLDTDLWQLPAGIRAEGLTDAAVIAPDGSRRAPLHWPAKVGLGSATVPVAGNVPDYQAEDLYHNDRLKLRNVRRAQTGDALEAYGWGGEIVARLVVQERGVRQEGRTR